MAKKLILLFGIVIIAIMLSLKYAKKPKEIVNELPKREPIVGKTIGNETIESRLHEIQDGVWERLQGNLSSAGFVDNYPKEIVLLALKEEKLLQVYSKGTHGAQLIKEYPFTAFSGKLGPKLKEGDKQIPEGIYQVEYLNPRSKFYLSIKINYPNGFDKSKTKLSNYAAMGGDIFIHGKSVTIGCIPIGDEAIEEVFVLTQKALNHKVKVIVSPRDFRVNPLYPSIENIDWEKELYDEIKEELNHLPLSPA